MLETRKKWSLWFIGMFITLIILIGATVIILDPIYHYHKPIEGLSYSLNEKAEDYMNDGIIKNWDYDCIIQGTSTSEGIKVAQVNELFDVSAVRITQRGEAFKRINQSTITAINENSDLKLVIRGFDPMWFISDAGLEGRDEYPEYLFDKNVWNDVNYLYNKDIWIDMVIPMIIRTIQQVPNDEFDGGENYWGNKDIVFANYERKERTKSDLSDYDYKMQILKDNIEQNMISTIRNNPNIEFYIYYPPYSILWWDSMNQNGVENLILRIEMERYVTEQLLKYSNVHLFSFFDNYEMITNLDNYVDNVHYDSDTYEYIIDQMAYGNHQLTENNYLDYYNKITKFYSEFEYDSLFE